jgi:hypothetical protein
MDPITTSALVAVLTKVFDGASGEAGRATWSSHRTPAKRHSGKLLPIQQIPQTTRVALCRPPKTTLPGMVPHARQRVRTGRPVT